MIAGGRQPLERRHGDPSLSVGPPAATDSVAEREQGRI